MYGLDSFLLLGWLPPLLPSKAPNWTFPARTLIPPHASSPCGDTGLSLPGPTSGHAAFPCRPSSSTATKLTQARPASLLSQAPLHRLSSPQVVLGQLLSYTDPRAACFRDSFLKKNTRRAASGLPCSKGPLSSWPRGSRLWGPFPSGLSLGACSFSQGPFLSRRRGSAKLPLTEAGRPPGGWVLGSGAGRAGSPAAPERRSLGAFARPINPSGSGTGGARAVPDERAGRGETGPGGLCGPCAECTGQVLAENDHVFMESYANRCIFMQICVK